MVSLNDLLDILKFQLKRDIFYLMKVSLELLEESRNNNLKLEKLLESAGFEDKELFKAEENFKNARKKVLDEYNNREKEVAGLIDKFNIKKDESDKRT